MIQTNLKNKIKPLLKQKAFTLIELLVVIAIIGVLSSVVLTSLNKSRQKAYLSKLIQDVNAVQNALELYYHDNGEYPPTNSIDGTPFLISGYGSYIETITETYLDKYISLDEQDWPRRTLGKLDFMAPNITYGEYIFYVNNDGIFHDEFNIGYGKCGEIDERDMPYTIYFSGINSEVPSYFLLHSIETGSTGTGFYCFPPKLK